MASQIAMFASLLLLADRQLFPHTVGVISLRRRSRAICRQNERKGGGYRRLKMLARTG